MKHVIKKSELINTLGRKSRINEKKMRAARQIKLSEEQFTRMLETYMDTKDMDMDEDFGDGDLGLSNPEAQSMVTQSADDYYMDTESASELDEDLNDFLGNMNEFDEGEEDLDEMWGALAKIAAGAAAGVAAEKLSDKYLEEKDDMMESIKNTYKVIRERIKIERPRGVTLMEYNSKSIRKSFLNEAPAGPQDEWGGRNPGVSAAAGIENIINSIKKGYEFIKDSRTRKQIANTLTKINNFMTYTGELVGSGGSQRAPRTYDQLANPLPYPELEQSAEDEAFEDIDDEINITEAYRRIGVSPRNIPRQYKRRLSEAEGEDLQLSYEITAPESWYQGIRASGCGDVYQKWLRKQPNWQKGGEAVSLYRMKPMCPIHEGMFDEVASWANWMWGGFGSQNKIYKAIAKQMQVDKARFMKAKAAGTTYAQLKRAGIIDHTGAPGHNSKEGKVASLELSREELRDNLEDAAYYVNKAVKGLGTDEDMIFRHLGKLKTYADDMGMGMSDVVKQLSSIYAKKYGESLMDALEGDLSGGDLRKAMGMLNERLNIREAYRRIGVRPRNIPRQYKRRLAEVQGINAERIAKELHDSMKGVGTNERKFWSIIQPTGRQGLTTDEMTDVREAFKNLYDESLCEWIKGDFSGGELRKALNAVGC